MTLLSALDQNVEIVICDMPRSRAAAEISVVGRDLVHRNYEHLPGRRNNSA